MKYFYEIEAVQLTYALATGKEPLENIPQWFIDSVESGSIKVIVTDKIENSQYAIVNNNQSRVTVTDANSFIIKGAESYFTCMSEEDFKKHFRPKP